MELVARYNAVSAEKSAASANQLLAWCRDYFKSRVNSRWIDERRCIPPHVVLDFGNRGVFGYHIDAAYGGSALRARDWVRVLAQLGSLDPTVSQLVLINALANRTVMSFGAAPLKAELLPQLAKGRLLAAFAQTERAAGTNFMAMETLAEEDGSGWRLSGGKTWIGNAGWAGVMTVVAKNRGGGMVALVVRTDAPGVHIGVELNTMGLRGVVQNEVSFDNVLVPGTNLLGGPSQGGEVAVDAMTFTAARSPWTP
jgi:alkylation response protein AidB-like acyl-CoA dehydrogenase